MRKVKWVWSALLIMAFCMLSVYGQAKLTGEVSGTAVTENGEFLPGVNVVLTGEKMFQKQLTAVTNENGQFRFIRLNPGKYEIEFSISGFNTVKITGLPVSLGQTTPVKAVMAQASINTEIVVRTEAPLIETKNVQLSTNFTTDMVAQLPTGRNIQDLMEATAGINDRGAYGAGGNADGDYYSGSSTSAYLFNGVDVSDLNSGATWVSPNYDTIEEIQVVGIGASAEYSNFSGAVLNVITKAGSNKFHGGMSVYYTGSSLQGDNSKGVIDLKPGETKYDGEASVYVGGPIIKEKLFFFLAGGYTGKKSLKYGDPEYSIIKQPHMQGRLDWVPSTKHQLSFIFNSDPLNHDNLGLTAGSGEEVGYSRIFRSTALNANWQFVMSPNLIITLKYAGFRGKDLTSPNAPDAVALRDKSTGRMYGSAFEGFATNLRERDQVNGMLTHYADNFLGTSHEFKFGAEYEHSVADDSWGANGDSGTDGLVNITIRGVAPNLQAYGWAGYGPFQTKPMVNRLAGFIQDNFQIGKKLNVNVGLRYDDTVLKANLIEGKVTEFKNFAPRLGLSYDITGDAKNVIRMSYGRYFDKTVTGGLLYAFKSFAGTISAYMLRGLSDAFDPDTQSIADFARRIRSEGFLLFSMNLSDPYPVDKNITSPYTDVINVGFEKALFKDWALSLDYIYKQDRNFIAILNHTQHTYAQRQWTDPYIGRTITIWDQVDSAPDDWYYGNSKFEKRRHHLVMLTLKKRPSANWSMMGSVVYQDSRGNVDNNEGPVTNQLFGLDTDPQFTENSLMWGKLTYNNTWQFKLLGTYQLPLGFSISGNFRVLSGMNWTPLLHLNYQDQANRSGFFTTLLEKRGSRQYPWSAFVDVRIAKNINLSNSKNLELIVDVFNLLNKDNAASYFQDDYVDTGAVYPISHLPTFGKPAALCPPFGARFGIRMTF